MSNIGIVDIVEVVEDEGVLWQQLGYDTTLYPTTGGFVTCCMFLGRPVPIVEELALSNEIDFISHVINNKGHCNIHTIHVDNLVTAKGNFVRFRNEFCYSFMELIQFNYRVRYNMLYHLLYHNDDYKRYDVKFFQELGYDGAIFEELNYTNVYSKYVDKIVKGR